MAAAMGGVGDVQRSFRTALHAVADALSSHGFAAHAERRGDQLRIVSDHCPFGDAAIEHPVICAVDRGMVKGMLSALYGDTTPLTEASRTSFHKTSSPPSPPDARGHLVPGGVALHRDHGAPQEPGHQAPQPGRARRKPSPVDLAALLGGGRSPT